MSIFVCVKAINFWIKTLFHMWSSDWKYLCAFECLLKILKDFQGLKLDRISGELGVPKQRSCLCGVRGPAVVQGEAVLAGVPGWNCCWDPPSARGCWVSLPMWAAQTACTESCSAQPLRGRGSRAFSLGAMLHALALLERREEGSSWQQSVLPQCFWGWCCRLVSLPESFVFWTHREFYLKSCFPAELTLQRAQRLGALVLLIRVLMRNLQVEQQIEV